VPRRFPIFQLPNRPLITAGAAGLAASISEQGRFGGSARRLSPFAWLVSQLALAVWALEEIFSGANWFRRLLGLAGGGYALSRLLESTGSIRESASAP
jgi:hypothetical protein